MNLVHTTKGLIDIADLVILDEIENGDNVRKIVTKFLHNGEVVRQDAAVSILRGVSAEATHGDLG